jgi:hypothetical protein
LGEARFRGIQVYDVIQDKKLNYLFATNEGIFYFDYYRYEKVECDEAKSNSVFNFVINDDGTIYCHNLNNQVFEIREGKCRLFCELKNGEGSTDISLSIADNDNLIIGASKIIVMDKKGVRKNEYDIYGKYLGPPFKMDNSAIQFHIGARDSVLIYAKDKFSAHKLKHLPRDIQALNVLKFFRIGGLSYALDLNNKMLYKYDPSEFNLQVQSKNHVFERSQSVRIYETGQEVWVAGTLPGIARLNSGQGGQNNDIFYQDFFISDVYKDNEGNILLSTFDKGILVIPDLGIPDVISSFRDDPVTALYGDHELGIVMGSSQGKLMNYINGKLTFINDKGKRPIEAIYGSGHSDFILFDDGHIRAYQKHTKQTIDITEASLKDAAIISDTVFYIGTNKGILKATWKGKTKVELQPLREWNQRIYCMEYNPADSCLYASTVSGLFVIFSSGLQKKISFNEKDLFPNDMYCYKGKLYASTKRSGILTIEKDKVINSCRPMVNGNPEVLNKIIVYKDLVISNSSNGFFQFEMNGKLIRSIHSGFGFPSNRVIDFTFHNDKLWVSHSGGVQQIDLDYRKNNKVKPVIRMDKILVNDELIQFLPEQFQSTQRKVQFIFSCPTLKNRESIRYYYKLLDYDNEWHIQTYEANDVTYNALAPGNYTFQLKAEDQGLFSQTLSYSFSIAQPFYTRWWFIILIIGVFLLMVYLIYRWQLNLQRQKSQQINELNASKLTAIQSQMNPHFIFNSLNSIQDLILKGDVEHSYSYITTFSNLVRRTLSYSDKDFIDFEQEVTLIELYLSLEKLRFKKDFAYSINATNNTDIQIPPMLIQPFIENALVHGLLHKEGEKILRIRFELKEDLVCVIEDNGVGREKAKRIKQRQRSEYESFSGKAIHKRFEILRTVFQGAFGFTYEDLYQNNEPAGTRVILTIPVKHKF